MNVGTAVFLQTSIRRRICSTKNRRSRSRFNDLHWPAVRLLGLVFDILVLGGLLDLVLLGLGQTFLEIGINLLASHTSRPYGLVEAVGLLGFVSDILVLGGLLNLVLHGLGQTLLEIGIGLLASHTSGPYGLVEAVGLLGLVSDILVLGVTN